MVLKSKITTYITGILSGMLIYAAIDVRVTRPGAPGGEVLILPLIFMLLYCGWTAHKEYQEVKNLVREEESI